MNTIKVPAVAAATLALLLTGCGRVSKDTSRVVANIGTEKITEQQFRDVLKAVIKDEAKLKEVQTGEGMREQRNQFLSKLADSKAILQLAKAEGLDKDPVIKVQLELAAMQVYTEAMVERRMPKVEPTDAELKAKYDEIVASLKAQSKGGPEQPVPPFEQVKAQLAQRMKQEQVQIQGQKAMEQVRLDSQKKAPITIAEDYKSAAPTALPVPQEGPQGGGTPAPAPVKK